MRKHKKIIEKIGLFIIFLCISLAFLQTTSDAAWVKVENAFKRSNFSSYNWTKRAVSSNKKDLKVSSSGATKLITNYRSYAKRQFSEATKLDKTQGLLCLQHEKKSSKVKHKIRKNIRVDGREATYEIDIKSRKETVKTKNAAMIAYIITHTNKSAGKADRRDCGAQGALWRVAQQYYKSFVDGESADKWFLSQIDDDGTDLGSWANKSKAEKLEERAQEYAAMNPVKPEKVSQSNEYKEVGDSYIVWPFVVKFTDYSVESRRYAGEKDSTFNDSKVTICDANGTKMTPKSGKPFYIKLPKSLGAPEEVKGVFTFNCQRFNVKAEWYDIGQNTSSQDHMFVQFAYEEYVKEKLEFQISLKGEPEESDDDDDDDDDKEHFTPGTGVVKVDQDTGYAIGGMYFKVKNGSGYYFTGYSTEKDHEGEPLFDSRNMYDGITFVSNQRGEIHVGLPGGYYLEEFSVGENWQYEVPKSATYVSGGNQQIKNQKKYMDLSRLCMGRCSMGSRKRINRQWIIQKRRKRPKR